MACKCVACGATLACCVRVRVSASRRCVVCFCAMSGGVSCGGLFCPGACRVLVCFAQGRDLFRCVLPVGVSCFGVFCPGACRVSVCFARWRVMRWCVVFGRVRFVACSRGCGLVVFGVRVSVVCYMVFGGRGFVAWCFGGV